MNESSKKENLDQLDKKIEEFKSKKEESRPKRLKVQNDGWRMVIELVTGMVLGISLGMALDYIVGSEPIFLILFSLLGFMAGVKTMIATAKKMNETKAAEYRNKFLGFVFQSFNLINYKNALDNVILPLYYQGISRKVREKKALKYLSDVGLKNWSHHLPNELSGGQKQRVAIARAMVSEPKVLLADEPTGALDSNTSKEVMDLIQKINKAGKTILVVTHEHDISQMCSRIVKLKDGVIVEDKKIKQKKAL